MPTNRKYIKVFIEELETISREKELTRAEIAALVLLALDIDDNNIAMVSKKDSARRIGMKSPDAARTLQRHLQRKGALEIIENQNNAAPMFKLPNAFAPGDELISSADLAPNEREALAAWRNGDGVKAAMIMLQDVTKSGSKTK